MDIFEATDLRAAHDADAKKLNRMSAPKLRELWAAEQAKQGYVWIAGGPQSRDELARAILDCRYPLASLNHASHVLYHKPGENWSACDHCQAASVTS